MVGLIAMTLMLAGCIEEQPAAEEEEATVLAVANVFDLGSTSTTPAGRSPTNRGSSPPRGAPIVKPR